MINFNIPSKHDNWGFTFYNLNKLQSAYFPDWIENIKSILFH